jgi:AraC-like DNA-binding protein
VVAGKMPWQKWFKRNKWFVRLSLSFLISGIVLTTVLLLVVSRFVAQQLSAQTNQANLALIRQAYQTSYYALTDVYGDFYQLWTKNNLVKTALTAEKLTSLQADELTNQMEDVVFENNLVHSVYLINFRTGQALSNLAKPAALADFMDPGALTLLADFAKNYDRYKNEVFLARPASLNINGQTESLNYMTMVLASYGANGQVDAALIANINQDRLWQLFRDDTWQGQMIILNRSGQVIADGSGQRFGQDFPRADVVQAILASPAGEGSLQAEIWGESDLLTWQKADTLGFIFMNATPLNALLAEVARTNRVIAFFFMAAMLLSLLVGQLATRRIYAPLRKLVQTMQTDQALRSGSELDEYSFLDSAYRQLLTQSRQSRLVRLLNGLGDRDTLQIFGPKARQFLPMAFMADEADKITAEWLEKMAGLIREKTGWPAAVTSSECVSTVLAAESFSETDMERLVAQVGDLQQLSQEQLGLSVAVGIGSVAASPADLKACHHQAIMAVQQALTLGQGQVVTYADIDNKKVSASQNRSATALAIEHYIQDHLSDPGLSADAIADHVGLSVGYMRQVFRLERSLPVNDYIISCRIQKACNLLKTTDLTAREIGEAVGYLDSRYFYTLFKKKVGMTTDTYRRTSREDSDHGSK